MLHFIFDLLLYRVFIILIFNKKIIICYSDIKKWINLNRTKLNRI
jgi:hypothetical protein